MSICGNLPINPNQSTAVVGKDFLLFVNAGTSAAKLWALVGGQRSSDLNRSGETIDTSSKSSGSWGGGMVGTLTWTIDLDAICVLNDVGARILECAFVNRKQVNVRLERPDGTYYEGWGAITDFSLATPHDDVASLTGTITGDGELLGPLPALAPLIETVKLAAVAEKTFAFEPTTLNVTALSRNGEAVESEKYAYADGVLTLQASYLSTLAIGSHTFRVMTDVASAKDTGGFAELVFQLKVTA